jgi:hypothetical protein
MSNQSKQQKQKQKQNQSSDPVAVVQGAAALLPPKKRPTKQETASRRGNLRRAPSGFITLVLALAEQNGGVVAGVAVDAEAAKASLTQASRLRVGAVAARGIAVRLGADALELESSVAQTVLAAVGALEAQSRSPGNEGMAATVASLREAAQRRPRAKAAKPVATPAPPPAAPTLAHT